MKVTQFITFTQCLILITSLLFYVVCGRLPSARCVKQLALFAVMQCAKSRAGRQRQTVRTYATKAT